MDPRLDRYSTPTQWFHRANMSLDSMMVHLLAAIIVHRDRQKMELKVGVPSSRPLRKNAPAWKWLVAPAPDFSRYHSTPALSFLSPRVDG